MEMKSLSIDAIPHPAVVIDTAHTIQFTNHEFVRVLGYENERMFVGFPLSTLLHVPELRNDLQFDSVLTHAEGRAIAVSVQVRTEPHTDGFLVVFTPEESGIKPKNESIECKLARTLVSAADKTHIYQDLLELLTLHFGFAGGALFLKRGSETHLDFEYSYALPESVVKFLLRHDSREWHGINSPLFFSRDSIENPISPLLKQQGVRSMLLIPIHDKESLRTIFVLLSFSSVEFEEPQLAEVNTISAYLEKIFSRLNYEEQLERDEKLFRSLVRSMPSGLIVRDRSEKIIFYNLAAARLFGMRNDTTLDPQTILKELKILNTKGEMADPDRLPSIVSLREGRKIRNYELEIIRADGSRRWVTINSEPLFHTGKIAPYAAVATLKDITENRRIVQEIDQSRQIAEEASKSKSRFLANISHEIRTPLSGIMGMTDMILGSDIGKEQREQLLLMKDAEESLLNIINKVLELSKIESGNIIIENNTFLLRSTLKKAVLPLFMGRQPSELSLDIDIPDDIPNILIGDALRLQQVLANLVANAIKFTEHGQVSVAVSLQKEAADSVTLCFTVKDSGVGIAKSELERIFDSFQQIDSSFSKRHQGSGLGLSITRQLVEIMGGEIWVESMPGQGSSFFFTISFLRGCGDGKKRTGHIGTIPSHSTSLSILLAEDNELNQKSISYFLRELGHQVELAQNGKEVLDKLRQRKFNLVLMDVQMPVMNGLEATRTIRNADTALFNPQIPIIALTAYAMKDDVHHILSSGMNAYVSKPLSRDILAQAIASVLHHDFTEQQVIYSHGPKETDEGLIDFSTFVQDYQGDLDIAKQLLELFYRDVPGRIEEVEAALSADNLPHTVDVFHSLTNNLSAVRLYGLGNISRTLEREALRGNTDRVKELFPDFKADLEAALQQSRHYLSQINQMLDQ
jgi:PAS domain S-box-containing protein